MADAQFESFFGAGGGGVGLFPVFPPKKYYRTYSPTNPRGFLGDGDYVLMVSGTLEYYNNAGASVWAKIPTGIAAGCDIWMGFNLDLVDNLIWVVAANTTAEAIFLATVDQTGTVVVKGSFVSATPLTANNGWASFGTPTAVVGASMWRSVAGAGDFTVVTSGVEYVINHITGAKVSETARGGLLSGSYKFGGRYFSVRTVLDSREFSVIDVGLPSVTGLTVGVTSLVAPQGTGLAFGAGATGTIPLRFVAMQWGGDVYLRSTAGSANTVYDRAEFNEALDQLITNYRLDQ